MNMEPKTEFAPAFEPWSKEVQEHYMDMEASYGRDKVRMERLTNALIPFARFACDPVGSCEDGGVKCHNCIAKEALER